MSYNTIFYGSFMAKCRINLYDICHTLELGISEWTSSLRGTISNTKQAFMNEICIVTLWQAVHKNTETDRNGPKRTGTDRNGPERTGTDVKNDRNGLEIDRNGLEIDRNGLLMD